MSKSEDLTADDEEDEQLRATEYRIPDDLPPSIASLDCYDVEAEPFEEEWIVGSRVEANIVTRSGPLHDALQRASEELDVPYDEKEYIVIETADVDNVSTDRVKIPTDVFENITEWYVEQRGFDHE